MVHGAGTAADGSLLLGKMSPPLFLLQNTRSVLLGICILYDRDISFGVSSFSFNIAGTLLMNMRSASLDLSIQHRHGRDFVMKEHLFQMYNCYFSRSPICTSAHNDCEDLSANPPNEKLLTRYTTYPDPFRSLTLEKCKTVQ